MGWRKSLSFALVLWFSFDGSLVLSSCPTRCQCDLIRIPRTVNCSLKGLQTFPDNVSSLVELLDLSGNLLTELPTNVNQLTELWHLNLSRNNISSLPANLRGFGKLREIDLSENALTSGNDFLGLNDLKGLKTLYLSKNPLTELDNLKNPSLHFLKANSCGIKKLSNTSLLGLPELLQLNLANNPLNEIAEPISLKLKILDLSKCSLKILNPNTLFGFPELVELRLSDNPTLVYSTRFETLRHQKLQKIDVSRCNLDRPGLHGFPSLTYAKLSGNSIHMLPDRIFSKNRELTHLFLDYNQLQYLNKSVFVSLSKLQVLDLSQNGLKKVPSVAFRENVVLQFLNLSDNYLTDFPKISSSIVNLDLRSNFISKMDNEILQGLSNLRYLDLSKNLFREMPKKLVTENLKNLNLNCNQIGNLNNVSLNDLPELEKLDLSGNLLENGINPNIFYNNPKLKVYLHGNPWTCGCSRLLALYRFLKSTFIDTDLLICHSPSNMTGYSWQLACAKEWSKESILSAQGRKTYGLILVGLLTLVVFSGMIVSIRHTVKLKRQARNHRMEVERAEVRERLRLLQRRNQRLHEELQEHNVEPRIHPLELIGPPSYEEALTMTRLARSLDALDSINGNQGSVVLQITGSSESLRITGKKRRPRRTTRRLRSQSEDNLSRREFRREERLRRARESMVETEDGNPPRENTPNKVRPPTPMAAKRKDKRSVTSIKNGTSTDDEDSDIQGKTRDAKKIGKTIIIRNLNREPRNGYKPSDGES